jgi:dTDP-4-amino-4,6-dideoxygalactose transaminase
MTEFQAALGQTQMHKLDRIIAARQQLSYHYDELLANTAVQAPVTPLESWPVYQSYVVLLPEQVTHKRGALIAQLKERGIETTIGTWHMPLTHFFGSKYGYHSGDYPTTDQVFARSLTLPLHENLSEDEQRFVVAELLELVER